MDAADNGAKEKKVTTDASKDKRLSNDGNKQGLAGNTNSSGAFGDNTIPMGMAFQSFGGGMGQSPAEHVADEHVGPARFPDGEQRGLRRGLEFHGDGCKLDEHGRRYGGHELDEHGRRHG